MIANVLLKNLVARVRPYDVNTAVNLLISKPTDWSFPSGHTTASFGAAAALLYADKKFGIAAYIIAAIIAFSRMYLYVHYPTDILGGIAVGTLSFFIVITVYKHINWEKAASRLHNKS
jgi:undecaprenyl-diphosphatase